MRTVRERYCTHFFPCVLECSEVVSCSAAVVYLPHESKAYLPMRVCVRVSCVGRSLASPPVRLVECGWSRGRMVLRNDGWIIATTDENFAASQMVAAVLCTVAVILATVAFFRPFGAERGSSTTLGLASGVFMTLFAFCQILALLFFTKNVQERESV